MNGRGNKPADVIVPELLSEILKEQRKMSKVLSEMDLKPEKVSHSEPANSDLITEQKKTNDLLRSLIENTPTEDNRPLIKKLKDLADDGIMNKSNKKVKPTRKKSKK